MKNIYMEVYIIMYVTNIMYRVFQGFFISIADMCGIAKYVGNKNA